MGEAIRYTLAVDDCPIYQLPVIGAPLRGAREFFDDVRPTEDDSFEVALGTNVMRYGTVGAAGVGATAVAAIVCL